MNQTEMKSLNKNVFRKSLVIGFCGGVIWSTLFILLYVFKVIEINPMIIMQSIFGELAWFKKWYAYGLLALSIGLLSTIIAIIYYSSLKKLKAWVVGALYGIAWWLLLILLLPNLLSGFNLQLSYSFDTYIASLCVFILYGTFIGYSISFAYHTALNE